MAMHRPIYVPYNVAREHIATGDVLSYRARWSLLDGYLSDHAIQVAGRGAEVHTGMAYWRTGRLEAMGMRFSSGMIHFLANEVRDNDGLIDVYRLSPSITVGKYDRHGNWRWSQRVLTDRIRHRIANRLRDFCTHDKYGWAAVLRSSLQFIPGLRWISRPSDVSASDKKAVPYCSQADKIAIEEEYAPILQRPSHDTLPADIVTSPHLHYQFTLVAPVKDKLPLAYYVKQAYLKPEARNAA